MSNSTMQELSTENSPGQVDGFNEYRKGGKRSFFHWWYALTAIPEPEGDADPSRRELARKSRLLSVIVFCLLIIFGTFIPACFLLPNPYVLVADLSMLVINVLALILNRTHRISLAGVLLVLSFEAAITMVIFTTLPLDEPSVQQYELLVFGELLAVSLLNARSVFLVAIFNSFIVVVSMVYQPHTLILDQDLQTQFWPMLLRPVAVQLLVAGVAYLWVSSATNYIARAYEAERVATGAQQIAEEQKEAAEQERQRMQASIERVVHNHANAMNQRIITKIPLTEYEPVLWPLVNVFNSLQNRLQHSHQTESDLQLINQAITTCAEMLLEGKWSLEQPPQTKTSLDMLFTALREQVRRSPQREESPRQSSLLFEPQREESLNVAFSPGSYQEESPRPFFAPFPDLPR
jgi:hypothetical protein